MNKNLVSCLLVMVLTLLLVVPSASAATKLSITGAKTDTMTSFDKSMPSVGGIVPRENTPYHPAYPKPNEAIHLEVTSSGITYPFYVMQTDGNAIKHAIVSTTYTKQGRIDNVKILIKDITYGTDPSNHWHLANKIHIRSWSGSIRVDSTTVSPRWNYK